MLAVLVCLLVAPAMVFAAAGGERQDYVPNEILVQLKSSADYYDLSQVLSAANARVKRELPLSNWYQLESLDEDLTYTDMSVALAGHPAVQATAPNHYMYLAAIPNDTYWNLLWGMRMIRMPEAWDITRGSSMVRVAVLDSGFRLDHPDLQGRWLPGTDVSDGDDDVNPPVQGFERWMAHGTHVAGTIGAQGNNGIGVVGVAWEGVRLIPIKCFPSNGGGATTTSDIVLGLDAALIRGAQVVNMSLGGPFPNPALAQKITQLHNAGVILVASAGNEAGAVSYPAAYPEVIAVSALASNNNLASYSNFGPEVSVAAPGGDFLGDGSQLDPEQIVSTVFNILPGMGDAPVNGYEAFSGTSMASPHVAGAAAILLSAGVPSSNVRAALEGGARPTGVGVPNNRYGYGTLDVFNSLNFNPVNLQIVRPQNGDFLATRNPFFRLQLSGAAPETVRVTMANELVINGGVPVDSRVGNFRYNTTAGEMTFTFQFAEEGSYRVVVQASATFDTSRMASRSVSFRIQGVEMPAGRYLFSYPFASPTDNPAAVIGHPLYRMARAVPYVTPDGITAISYSFYNYPGLVNDPEASLRPPSVYAAEIGGSSDTLPRGVGYWLDLRAPARLLANSFTDDRFPYELDIMAGWNQIGNPFPYPIAWGNVLVTYMGQTTTVAQAAARGWISPTIFRFENGVYRYETAPLGTLRPFTGYWVKSRVPRQHIRLNSIFDPRGILTLTFMPLQSAPSTSPSIYSIGLASPSGQAGMAVTAYNGSMEIAANAVSRDRRRRVRPVGPQDWQMAFSVEQSGKRISGPVIGASETALDTYDSQDIETPPQATFGAWAAVNNRNWGVDSGYYIQDIRSSANRRSEWLMSVMSYEKGPVTLAWENLSRLLLTHQIEIEDTVTGRMIDIRNGSYTFDTPDGASSRQFRVSVTRRMR